MSFDKDTFLSSETTDALETTFTPVDEGDYNAFIDDVEVDVINTSNGQSPILRAIFAITDDEVKEKLGLDKPTVRLDAFLELNEEGGLALGKNKNVKLGRLRDSVDQNEAGEAWSPSMLRGAGPVTIKVGHRYNKETGEGPYAFVSKVTKA